MIRTKIACTGLILAASLAACAPDPDTSFANARQAFAANDYRAARVALVSGLRERPDNHEMRVLLARAQVALGDAQGAAATLAKLPAAMAKRSDVAILAGETAVLRGQFDEANRLVANIDTASADRIRALAAIGLGQPEAAAEAFATGAQRDLQDAGLLASYARFSLVQGDPAMADSLVGRALKLDPRLVEAYLVRADIMLSGNKLPGAMAAFERALDLHASNFDARVGKASVLVQLGRIAEAKAIAAELSNETAADNAVVYLDARIAAREGDWAKVRSLLQPLEAELRDDPAMPLIYGEALVKLDQPALALGILEPELVRQPGSRALRRLVANAQFASNDAATALATIRPLASRPDATPAELKLAADAAKASGNASAKGFEQRAATPSPEWIGGELAKADRALRNRQWADAERGYETILARTDGRNALVLNNLAFAKGRLGKDKEALALALKAAKIEPDNASILDTAGWLLVQTGSKARGIEMLRKAAQLAPDNAAIARHLAEAQAR